MVAQVHMSSISFIGAHKTTDTFSVNLALLRNELVWYLQSFALFDCPLSI